MFHIFSHSSPPHFSPWNCESHPKLRKSFVYHLCIAWCPTSRTDLLLECQTCQTCLMKEFEWKPLCLLRILRPMNVDTNWIFPTKWVAFFLDVPVPIHWVHAYANASACIRNGKADYGGQHFLATTSLKFNQLWCLSDRRFNVSHLFTFKSSPLLPLKLRESPETAKVIYLSFVYGLVSNI